MTSVNNITTTC